MDQNAVVTEEIENGRRLIETLRGEGFDVGVAFWAKPTEEGKWYLYLASSIVDEQGLRVAYSRVNALLRKTPDLEIDPFEVKVIGRNDSLAEAALAAVSKRTSGDSFAARTEKPHPGMIRFVGSFIAGVEIDGAFIYPLPLTKA